MLQVQALAEKQKRDAGMQHMQQMAMMERQKEGQEKLLQQQQQQQQQQPGNKVLTLIVMERGSSAVERRTRNRESLCSNPPLLSFRSFGIFVLFLMPQFTQLCGNVNE